MPSIDIAKNVRSVAVNHRMTDRLRHVAACLATGKFQAYMTYGTCGRRVRACGERRHMWTPCASMRRKEHAWST